MKYNDWHLLKKMKRIYNLSENYKFFTTSTTDYYNYSTVVIKEIVIVMHVEKYESTIISDFMDFVKFYKSYD
jgi:hypothetical protein